MPNREHNNTCEATLSALENIRDMDQAATEQQPADVQEASRSLSGWKRGQELDDITNSGRILEIARDWAALFVMDDLVECDCDAKYVHVIARRWHRGHTTTAPARVIARIHEDTYLIEFLTDGPGAKQQTAFRSSLGVALDDIAYLDAMEIDRDLLVF